MPTFFQSISSQFADSDSSARAINLARRMTSRNEPDLLQEDMWEANDDHVKTEYSHDYCKVLASTLHSRSDFPLECMQYDDAAALLHAKNEAYVGMSPGEKVDAMRAKDEGHLNGAQIKRRMTTKKANRFY